MLVPWLQRNYRLGLMSLSLFLPLLSFAQERESSASVALTAIGTLIPSHKSALGSIVSGRVDKVFVEVGDSVTKGQALLQLDQTLFVIAVEESRAAALSAELELQDAVRNYERMKKLFDKPEGQSPAISLKRLEDAQIRSEQAQVAKAKADHNVHKAQTHLEETVIKAPYDGVITKRFVHPGEPVSATPVTKVIEIVALDTLYAEFSLPQTHRFKVHLGDSIEIEVEGTVREKIVGIIDVVYPDIDEKTRSIKLRSIVPNLSRELQPGALIRVKIPLKEQIHASI